MSPSPYEQDRQKLQLRSQGIQPYTTAAGQVIADPMAGRRQAEQDQADAEQLVTQRQREEQKAAQTDASNAFKTEQTQREHAFRSEGATTYTTADGVIHKDPLFEQKQAAKAQKEQDKAAKDAADLAAKQARATAIRSGRRHQVNPVDGSPIYLESEEDVAQRQKDAAQSVRKKTLDTQIKAAEAEFGARKAQNEAAGLRPLSETGRKNLAEKVLPKTRQEALFALQSHYQNVAKGTDKAGWWDVVNNNATPEARAAQEHLKRLQDPNADLTDKDLQILQSSPDTRPIADRLQKFKQKISKDDELQKFHAEHGTRLADLTLRRDAPDKWAELIRQRRAQMSPEQLRADLETSSADLTARRQALQQKAAELNSALAAHTLELDQLSQQAAARRSQGIPAGEIVSYKAEDGTVEHWPRDLAAQREAITARLQDTQAMQQDDWTRLKLEEQDYITESGLVNEASQHLNQVNEVSKVQQSAAFSNRLRFTPGMENAANEIEALQSEADLRAQDLADMHPDGVPEEAQQALQDDIQQRQQASLAAGQQRQQAAAAAYQGLQSALLPDKNGNTKADSEVRPTVIANLAEALQVDPQEAERLLSDMQTLNWDAESPQDRKEKTPADFAAKAKALRDSSNLTGFASALAQTASDIWQDKPSDTRQTRLLSNGAVVVNPTITTEKDYTAAVNASTASPEAKADALDRFPDIRQNAGAQVRQSFQELEGVYGKEWVKDWLDYDAKRPQDVSPEEWAMRFTEDRKNDSALRRVAQEIGWSFYKGGNQLRQQVSGLVGGITGSETAMQDATWAGRKSQAMQTSKELYGSASDNFLRAGLLEMTPEVATSIIPAAGGAKLAQWGIRGLAATGAGARLFPALAAVIEGSSTAAQAVKATQTLTRAGLAGASLAGGAQTYGAQISDIYGNLRRQGIEHPDALRMAQTPAILSAGVTAALTALGGASGVERLLVNPASAKALFAKQFETQMKRLGFVGQKFVEGGLREFALEELPDEIFSTWQSGVASHPDDPNAGRKALAEFLKTLPEFAVATGILGGAGEAISSYQESSVLPAMHLRPETTATAWSAIENHRAFTPNGLEDPNLTAMEQNRASLALHLAQGGELFDVSEELLNAAGWTRDGTKFKPLKDYAGPQMLDIDTGGMPVIKDAYVKALSEHPTLAPVAKAIGMTETETRNFYAQRTQPQPAGQTQAGPQQPQPGAAQSAAPDPRGSTAQSPVQTPAGKGTQPPSSGQPPAQSGTPVVSPSPSLPVSESSTPSEAPTTPAEFLANHLTQRGLPADQALASAREITARPEFAGMSYEQIIAEGPKFRAALDDLGIDGSLNSKDVATNPLKVQPGSKLAKVKAEMEAKAAAVSQNTASQTPAKPASGPKKLTPILARGKPAFAEQEELGSGRPLIETYDATGKSTGLVNMADVTSPSGTNLDPRAKAKAAAVSQSPPLPVSPSGSLPPAVQTALDDAIPGTPSQAVFAAVKQAVQAKEMTEQQAAEIVAQQSGAQDHTELRQSLENKLGWNPTRANTAAALHFGDKSKSDIPLAAPKRGARQETTPGRAGPDQSWQDPASPLRKHRAWTTEKLRVLSSLRRPAAPAKGASATAQKKYQKALRAFESKQAWTREVFRLLENDIAKHHAFIEAIALGKTARQHLDGNSAAITVIGGKVTLAIDADALIANISDLESPQDRIEATFNEEYIHVAQKKLEALDPKNYGRDALIKKWDALPDALRKAVWTSYRNANQRAKSAKDARLPATLSDGQKYHLMQEFNRMLVQDQDFAGKITETVDPASGLLDWVKSMLQKLGDILREMITRLPKAQQSEIQEHVRRVSELYQQFASASQGTSAERLGSIPTVTDHQAVATQALTHFMSAKDGIFQPAALAKIWDLLDPSLQRLVFRSKDRDPVTGRFGQQIASRAPKHDLMRDLLAMTATDPAMARAVQEALLKPGTQATKSLNLLERLFTAFSKQTAQQPAPAVAASPRSKSPPLPVSPSSPLLAALSAQSPDARRALATLHSQTLSVLADLIGVRFVIQLPQSPAIQAMLEAEPPQPEDEQKAAAGDQPAQNRLRGRRWLLQQIRIAPGRRLPASPTAAPAPAPGAARQTANRQYVADLLTLIQQQEAADLLDTSFTERRAALDAEDAADHGEASTNLAGAKLRAKLRLQQLATVRARFFRQDNAVRELHQAEQAGRQDVEKAAAMAALATGRIGQRRTGAAWRTIGFTERRQLALLGIGVDQNSSGDQGGYPYTLSRRGMAEARVEFSLEGSTERQIAEEELDWMREQEADYQTAPDDTSPAYVQNSRENWTRSLSTQGTDHILLKQEALDDLALSYPHTAALIRPEHTAREGFGIPAAQTRRPITQDSAPVSQSPSLPGSESPSFTPLTEGQSPFAQESTSTSESPRPQVSPAPSLAFSIPLSKRGQVRRAQFPDADSLAAFQFKLDADTVASARSTPTEVKKAEQRGLALLARLMEETGRSRSDLEKQLLDYHTTLVQQAEAASAFGTFTPPTFTSVTNSEQRTANSELPPPIGGDILSGINDQGIRRLGPPDTSDGWAWYRSLQSDAALSKLKNAEAQRLARAGDITDAKAKLAWIDANIVSQTGGRSIDEAATELSESDAQQFPVTTGDELGQAILAALDARLAAKENPASSIQDQESRREAEALSSSQDFATYATGSQGQPFTADQLAQELEPEDEIQIGSEYLTVLEADKDTGTLTLDSSRFGSVTVSGDQTLNLASGPNHLRISSSPRPQVSPSSSSSTLAAARAELRAALQEAGLAASNRSLVTDADGKPLTLWHATWTPDGQRFEQFTKSNDPSGGFWFSTKDLTKQIGGNVAFQVQLLGEVKEFKGTEMELKRMFKRYGPSTWDTDAPGGIFAVKDTEYGGTSYLVRNADQIIPLAASHRQPQITAQNAWAFMLAPSAKAGIATDYIDGLKVSLANANTLATDRAVSPAVRQKARQDAEQLRTLIPQEEAAWQRIRQQHTPQQLKQIHDDATAYNVPVAELQADLNGLLADFPDAATRPSWASAQIESLQSEISQSPRLPLSQSPPLAASPRIRSAAATYADNVFHVEGKRTFPDFLAYVAGDLPDLFPTLKTPHLRSAWNTLMAEKGLREITPAEEAAALHPYAPKIERRFGEMPPDIARRQAAIDEDDMGFPVAVPQGSADTPVRPVSTENSEPGTENNQSDFWGTNYDDYRLETRPVPEGSPMTANAIKAIAPYLISGNKGDLLGRHGTFYLNLVEPATVVLDAFGGAAIYTHFLAQQGALPAGSTWNEWEYSRSITNRQIKDAPAAVVREVISIRQDFDTAFPVTESQPTREDTLLLRARIFEWVNQRLRATFPSPSRDAMGRFTLPDTPQTAGMYLFLQNHMAENRVVDFDIDDAGNPRLFTGGKPIGKDDLRFVRWNTVTNAMEHARPSRIWGADMPTLIRDASRRFAEATIRQGDGWQLAADAPAGALVFVDTSYFPTDEQTADGAAVMNYGNTTLGDANPALWFQKFEKYLLPKSQEVRYVITNNFNGRVVDQLEKAGWTVLRTFRGSESAPSHEFIALSPAAVADLRLPAAPTRRYGPGGIPIRGGPDDNANGGTAQNGLGLPAGEPRQTGKRDPQSGLQTPALDATLAGGPNWDAVESARIAWELDQDRRPGDDPLDNAPEIDLADAEAQLQEDGDRFGPTINEEDDGEAIAAANRRVEYVEPGFYSALAEAIRAKMPARSTPATVVGILKNAGLKQEELKWTGIIPWLQAQAQDGPITQQQVLDYLATEGSVKFTITRLNAGSEASDQINRLQERANNDEDLTPEEWNLLRNQPAHSKPQQATRNTQWTLPGGTNPKEVVVTWKQTSGTPASILQKVGLSELREGNNIYVVDAQGRHVYREGSYFYQPTNPQHRLATAEEAKAIEKANIADKGVSGTSPNSDSDKTHYGDLDALAWYRTTDRTNAAGPGLLVEEFQSKWHQKGREEGYKRTYTPAEAQRIAELYAITPARDFTDAEQAEYAALRDATAGGGVPDAPYRTAWPLMLFKRALLDAVAGNKSWIGWTTGDTQADRYDLSKRVSVIQTVRYGDTANLVVRDLTDRVILSENDVPLAKVPELVGKDIARQIADQPENDRKDYRGENLRVGGAGMRKFYDDILVKEFGKYAKQLGGGTVEASEVNSSTQEYQDPIFDIPSDEQDRISDAAHAEVARENPGLDDESDDYRDAVMERITDLSHEWVNEHGVKPTTTPIHLIRITPAMREAVTAGQALFSSSRLPVAPQLDLRYVTPDGQDPEIRRASNPLQENHLGGGLGANAQNPRQLPTETSQLLPWAQAQGWLIDPDDLDRRLGIMQEIPSGDEHDVWHDELTDRAVKVTNLVNKKAFFVAGSPAAYIVNLRQQNALFDTGVTFEGIVEDEGQPRIVTSMPWIPGTASEQQAKEAYFKARGFDPAGDDTFYSMGRDLLVSDARPVNVLQRPDGTVQPIDIQVRNVSPRQSEMWENRVNARAHALGAADRTPTQTIEATGLAPAISVNGIPYTGRTGMFHPAILGDYVWRKVFTPQQRRDDPNQENAITHAYTSWMDARGSGFDDFGFLDTRTGKFITREEAYALLTERGFTPPPDSYSIRHKSLDSSDLFNSQPVTPVNPVTDVPLAASPRLQNSTTPSLQSAVANAASQTDPNPTDAQKRAGNYAKGKVDLHGLRISIENPAGSTRSGTDANGKPWSVTLPHHYGYILGSEGRDGDHVDVFIGPNPDSQLVLIVNQRKPGNGHFDEHKVMLGFNTPAEAARGYMASYSPGWKGLQSAVPTTLPVLKHWITTHDTTQPVTKEQVEKLAKTVPLPQSAHDTSPLAAAARAPLSRRVLDRVVALDRRLLAVPGASKALDLGGKATDLTGALATKVIKGLGQASLVPLRVNGYLADALGLQQPLATFGSNNLDQRLAAQLDKLAGPKIRSAKTAVETWLDKPDGLAPSIKGLVDQILPTALLPREWLALHHEMQRKTAYGQETANDLIRALSGNPRLSDLAYPKEFSENPAARAQLFDAMEGRIPMATLPPEMQRLGQRLRDLLRQTGSELVRQGLMNPDTFEELQSNGWMPRYTEDEARESAGSFLAAFKLGVRDLLQQRSTAYHIVDTTRKDKTGQYVTVSRDEGGKRNRWRFRDAASRDAFYHDFVRKQTLDMLQDRSDRTVADMLAPLSRGDKAAMRDQIKSLTADQIANTAKLSPMLAGIVKQAKKHQYDRFLPKDPFEPAKLIKDPVYAVARYVLGQTHNAATMELLRKTAQNPEWTSDVSLTGFEAIPDASRFGPLAGKHVRKDIAAQILDLVDVPNAALQFYDAILRKWKAGKLVWNPGSHVRDAVGNTMFAFLGGSSIWNPGNWPYYQQAIAALRTGGQDFAELIEQQVLGGDAYSGIVKDRLKGLLPDPKTVENYDPGFIQRLLFGFGANLHGSHEFMSSLRRLPDDLFKAAAYFKAKADLQQQSPTVNGSPATLQQLQSMAAGHVRKWFPYYDRLGQSGTTRAVGRFVNPFVSFFRESTRILGTAVAERPLALTASLAFPALITAVSAMALGLDDDDLEEIKKDMAGKGKLFATGTSLFSMLLPFRSAQGAVQQFDISAIMPFADLLGTRVVVTDADEDPWNRFWRGIVSGGPVLSLVDAWRHNEDAFTRRPIAEFGMTPLEKITAYTRHAAGVALPPLAPGGTAFNTLMRAGDRSTNKTLEKYDPTQAVVRSVVGLNVKNATPDLYRLADDWRKAHGYEVTEGMDYGSTTPASRARKALFAKLAQDKPNLTAIKNILASLDRMGHPVRTEQDINRLLFYRDPLKLIGGNKAKGITATDAQNQFRSSLTGEARQQLEAALREYQRIKASAPSIVKQAASL